MESFFYVYILHCTDGKLYTGYTGNLKRRFKKHQKGFVRATKSRRPLKLIHYETFLEEPDAKRRETYLKGGNGKKGLEILLKGYFEINPWLK